MKIAVFVSGGGTNLQAIIDNTKDGILCHVERIYALSGNSTLHLVFNIKNAPVCLRTSAICNKFHYYIFVKNVYFYVFEWQRYDFSGKNIGFAQYF